jgi:hypothetical protein
VVIDFGLASTTTDQFHDRTKVRAGNVDFQQFVRFALLAVDLANDDFRLANRQFITFATHGFDQYGQMQNTSTGNLEGFLVFCLFNSQSHIGLKFAVQSVTQISAGDELAMLTSQW